MGSRLPLRELIADVMPGFAESFFPIPLQWESLKVNHKVLGILKWFLTNMGYVNFPASVKR
jgi:hypothetical protein